jgi:hypothetical protein
VNPRLGRGTVTNHEAPEANATAEWKTTSPATTNQRITSNSGRRPAERPDNDCPAAVRCGSRRRDQLARWSRIGQFELADVWR